MTIERKVVGWTRLVSTAKRSPQLARLSSRQKNRPHTSMPTVKRPANSLTPLNTPIRYLRTKVPLLNVENGYTFNWGE